MTSHKSHKRRKYEDAQQRIGIKRGKTKNSRQNERIKTRRRAKLSFSLSLFVTFSLLKRKNGIAMQQQLGEKR
jgi:hypothetical protein